MKIIMKILEHLWITFKPIIILGFLKITIKMKGEMKITRLYFLFFGVSRDDPYFLYFNAYAISGKDSLLHFLFHNLIFITGCTMLTFFHYFIEDAKSKHWKIETNKPVPISWRIQEINLRNLQLYWDHGKGQPVTLSFS